MSIKFKFNLIILLNTSLVVIFAFSGFNVLNSSYRNLLYKSIHSSLSYSSQYITDQLNNIEQISELIISNKPIQNYLIDIKDKNKLSNLQRDNIYTQLLNIYNTFEKNNINSITLDLFNNNISYSWITSINTFNKPELKKLYQIANEANGKLVWAEAPNNHRTIYATRVIRRMKDLKLDPLANLVISINFNKLVTNNNFIVNQYEDASFIIYGDEINYYSDNISADTIDQFKNSHIDKYGMVIVDKQLYFAVNEIIPHYNWHYICLVPAYQISTSLHFTYTIIVIISFLGLLISLGLSFFLIKTILRHLDTLIYKMNTFAQNTIDTSINYTSRKDELGLLHNQFAKMVHEINHLIKINYITKLLQKEAQIKALEAQINPHFLYNTLESINWRAKAIGNKEISLMVESLGILLKATLTNKSSEVTLAQELKLITSYITIQKIRFEERLIFHSYIDKTLLDNMLPPLTIQPLIENAITYGMEEVIDSCSIDIFIEQNNNSLIIRVKNTGSIIDTNILEKLRDNTASPKRTGIGLLNIDQRIKLLYGTDYGLSISNEDDYAVVTVILPLH